jgi:hypothetical protein
MGGKVAEWVRSWWADEDGRAWCDAHLSVVQPDDWFNMRNLTGPRLWIPPPAAMLSVLEMFNEDRIVRPHLPHVFVVPRLMTHLWCKQLSKDADVVVFNVACGPDFWPKEMHEPLVVLIVFPLTHLHRYRGPWILKGTDAAVRLENRLSKGFKIWRKALDDPRELLQLEGPVPEVWNSPEEWSRTVLFQFLAEQRNFPPVHECLVRRLFHRLPVRPLPSTRFARRRGRDRVRPSGGERPSKRAKGRPRHGGSLRTCDGVIPRRETGRTSTC